ncbi:MAG: hypothetical protein AAGK23_06750 [Pseudomonadota bacterium]
MSVVQELNMRKLGIIAAISILSLSAPASAQVVNCGKDNRVAGTIIGTVVGGAAGGAIANNTTRHVFVGRGFRGSRFHHGHGFRHGRGFRRGRFIEKRGNQELGILLGALAGGIIGNQVASANARDCVYASPSEAFGDPYAPSRNIKRFGTFSHVNQAGPVDLNAVKFGDPFGGRPVVRTEPSTDGGFQTNTQSSTRTQTPLAGGVFEPICETVFQTTTLPDGTQTRAPVEVCQYSEGGEWIPS